MQTSSLQGCRNMLYALVQLSGTDYDMFKYAFLKWAAATPATHTHIVFLCDIKYLKVDLHTVEDRSLRTP